MDDHSHVSVLCQKVVAYLAPHSGGRYIDATVGAGGHAAAILAASAPDGRLLGLDADPSALEIAATRLATFGERAILRHSNFEHLGDVAQANGFFPATGIVYDLGLSSMQLETEARGFSLHSGAALDMRFNPNDTTTAADLVNSLAERELGDLIFKYSEERASRRIAGAIVRARPITTASDLADVIEKAIGRHSRVHPATRTFMALRIAVNRELEVLENALLQVPEVLAPGGRIVVITFHSLEDRIVKNCFRGAKSLRVLTKHPVRPARAEVLANPRSRSAKLRAAERVAL